MIELWKVMRQDAVPHEANERTNQAVSGDYTHTCMLFFCLLLGRFASTRVVYDVE